jgi:hypothetical protein
MENELEHLRDELARLKDNDPPAGQGSAKKAASIFDSMTSLASQPALWFALSGWAVAIVLLFRRRTI